jgi:hypothetical protein
MCGRDEALKAIHWGIRPQVFVRRCIVACAVLVASGAVADPITVSPDPPPAPRIAQVGPGSLPPSWDLDGVYLWLGPVGAASHVHGEWDSTIGGEAAVVRVREREPVAALGIDVGASRWTERGGGRVWVDGLVGTRALGRMMGASLGPILELSQVAHPHMGASVGLWGFAGITPFARIGTVSALGMFAEVGVYIALPVLRR